MYEENYISTHDGFMTMDECDNYGKEFMEEMEYDPVSGLLPKGYECIEVDVI